MGSIKGDTTPEGIIIRGIHCHQNYLYLPWKVSSRSYIDKYSKADLKNMLAELEEQSRKMGLKIILKS